MGISNRTAFLLGRWLVQLKAPSVTTEVSAPLLLLAGKGRLGWKKW